MLEKNFLKYGYYLIEDDKSLEELISNHIKDSKVISIDSEFLRYDQNSPPKLALVQFKTEKIKGAIDPLKCSNISYFISFIFSNKNLLKILHDGKQDLETFKFFVDFDISKTEIFDTQIAELFTTYYTKGTPSYKELVAKYSGKNISKYYQNSNWIKRPINEKQLAYAINDVEYLYNIYAKQNEMLKKLDRVEIFENYMIKKINNHINKIKSERNFEYFIEKEKVDEIYNNLSNNCEFNNISPSVIATKNDIRNFLISPESFEKIDKWKLKFLKMY